MTNQILHRLNDHFALPNHLSFHAGPGGLDIGVINNAYASAAFTLAGAHVMTYRPHGDREVLWSSPATAYELSNAMRGGIPVCWPWFAHDNQQPGVLPIHGLARTLQFDVTTARVTDEGGTLVSLAASDSHATRALWPHAFQIEITILLNQSLKVTWTARNPGSRPYEYTGALHPYFSVSNVRDVTVLGLEDTDYLDKYAGFQRKTQSGPVQFHAGVDNIYLDTTRDMAIEDPGFRRSIHLRKLGSRTSVVWNPAGDDATMPDVGAGQHPFFVCVESANAGGETITVQPGDEQRLGMEIECKSWRNP